MSYRAGFIGIVGLPNSGKSTLLNLLVEDKVSIVTAKPQTTRRRVTGIVNKEQGQLIFVDSPGIIRSETGLNSFLMSEFEDIIRSSDVILLVLSLDEKSKDTIQSVIDEGKKAKKPMVAVVTKMDLVEKRHRLHLIREMLTDVDPQMPVFEFSNRWGKDQKAVGDQIILAALAKLPESSQPLFDRELYTTETVRQLCEEMIRENAFELLEHEVPYGLAVKISSFDENDPNLTRIQAQIYVSKESHLPIVIGEKAQVIKRIGTLARKQIEKLVGHQIFLKLEVVYKENWVSNPQIMKDLGYVRHNVR